MSYDEPESKDDEKTSPYSCKQLLLDEIPACPKCNLKDWVAYLGMEWARPPWKKSSLAWFKCTNCEEVYSEDRTETGPFNMIVSRGT
jgi:hypothetical protein